MKTKSSIIVVILYWMFPRHIKKDVYNLNNKIYIGDLLFCFCKRIDNCKQIKHKHSKNTSLVNKNHLNASVILGIKLNYKMNIF